MLMLVKKVHFYLYHPVLFPFAGTKLRDSADGCCEISPCASSSWRVQGLQQRKSSEDNVTWSSRNGSKKGSVQAWEPLRLTWVKLPRSGCTLELPASFGSLAVPRAGVGHRVLCVVLNASRWYCSAPYFGRYSSGSQTWLIIIIFWSRSNKIETFQTHP